MRAVSQSRCCASGAEAAGGDGMIGDTRSVLVVGLGNPLLGDDGVGWRVAEQVQRDGAGAAEVDCLAVGGLGLMERLVGYDQAVIIDAITTGRQSPGTLYRLTMDDLPETGSEHLSSSHDMTLPTALRLGRSLGLRLPRVIWLVAVEAERTHDFAEALTPPVAAAVPRAARMVFELLRQSIEEAEPR